MSKLIAFAKHWRPGEAKTRLGAVIGMERAADFQRWCVERVLERLSEVAKARMLFVTPAQSLEAFQQITPPCWELRRQSEGDLGKRLEVAFDQAFEGSVGPVVAVGTDTPELSAERLAEALKRLEACDVVLGPAEDGGYYLIGLARPCPELFREMPWSSSRLTEQTLARAAASGLVVQQLPTLQDVDQFEDLQALVERLRHDEQARQDGTLAWLEEFLNHANRDGSSKMENRLRLSQ